MALIQGTYYSEALQRGTTFYVIMPNDARSYIVEGNPYYERPMKCLYLLHGYSGTPQDWFLEGRAVELSNQYNLMIVLPNGDNSFYLNHKGSGNHYETFVGEEIVSYIQNTFLVSKEKEDTFIGGFSMGGYGAIHTGLKYPETFGKMFGLSSAFIIHQIKGETQDFKTPIADYDYYVNVFGNLELVEESDCNPEVLIKKQLDNNQVIQPIYLACGTEDFLIKENRDFRDFLEGYNSDITYEESVGEHNWLFWNAFLEKAIDWLLKA